MYLAVLNCEGTPGVLDGGRVRHGRTGPPQILITIAARFGRMSWKMIQTFYLAATDMGLGGCAIGTTNIDLFAKITELEFHVESPVGQFALGRGKKPLAAS